MISTYDLILKAKWFLMKEPDSDHTRLMNAIIDHYHTYDQISPMQHTLLTSFCITCEWREEEFRRQQTRAGSKK